MAASAALEELAAVSSYDSGEPSEIRLPELLVIALEMKLSDLETDNFGGHPVRDSDLL